MSEESVSQKQFNCFRSLFPASNLYSNAKGKKPISNLRRQNSDSIRRTDSRNVDCRKN